MILKQRFADGKTAYTNIGDQFVYLQQNHPDFKQVADEYINNQCMIKDCFGIICYGDRKREPIYKDFPQWIMSNDGQLFMTLVSLES